MRILGIAGALAGLAIMAIAFFSVPAAPSADDILRQRIEAQSRQLDPARPATLPDHPAIAANARARAQNRTLAYQGGAALLIAGAILFAAGAIRTSRRAATD